MAEVDRIDSIYDVGSIMSEHDKVKKAVQDTIDDIKAARTQTIDLNVNAKTYADFIAKMKELEKTIDKMNNNSQKAVDLSIKLAKQKEAEAKAELANTRAKAAANRETERQTKNTERQAAAQKKANEKATEAQRPYKQLAMAFAAAAKEAQDLAVQYGVMDKRAQAAAKTANRLNDQLKAIDETIGIHNRKVGSYTEALNSFGDRIKNIGQNFLALIGVVGVGDFLSSAIDEFIEMDKNVRMLQNTLRNLGVPQAFARIEESANKLAKQFTYLDNDDVLKSFNQLIIYGKLTEEQMNELIPVIIDFAAATGQDLGSATSVMIKALEGNGKALKEYGINIKDAKSTTEAFGLIMSQLAPKVKGVGQAFQDSASGGLASAKQEFKDIKEEIGGGLLPILNSVLRVLIDIAKGAIGAGKALKDAFTGEKSFVASILESSDNKDIAYETQQVYNSQISALKNFQKQLADQHKAGRKLEVTEAMIQEEFIKGLKARVAERQAAYDKIKRGSDKQAIMSALADLRGMQRALLELDKAGSTIIPTGDPNKLFASKDSKKEKVDDSEFEILKANLELYKEMDLKRAEDEKLVYQERLQALIDFGNDSRRLIEAQAAHDLNNAELTAKQRLKIENDKNNALIRLATDLAERMAKITHDDFEVDTSALGKMVKGLPAEIQKALDNFKKVQNKAIEDHKKALKDLKKNTKEAVLSLVSELEGFFFDLFTNQIDRQKNAIQEQIDLLDIQKQKEIELVEQTITNANEKEAALALIEARAANRKALLEQKQRALDQQRARWEKAQAVVEITQSTALAVVNALAQVKTLGPGAIALAAVIGALGAIQIARVLAQPIPKYKDGTSNHPGGLMWVGDGGRAEGIELPDGTAYKSPDTPTLMSAPRGTKVYRDYKTSPLASRGDVLEVVDVRAELKDGFMNVVKAVNRIPQPIIHAESAWTKAQKVGSAFRTYINRHL